MAHSHGKCCKTGEPVRDPKQCTPEQIKACHGDAKDHSCENPKREGCCCKKSDS